MKYLTVNIFGGRDVGKTTIAMHTTAELRWLGIPTALTRDVVKFWGEESPIVSIQIFDRDPTTLTPHAVAEMCSGCLNFLVLRRKDYNGIFVPRLKFQQLMDNRLEEVLRSGHVQYKSLPGVRASVLYFVKKICDDVGYDK